MFVASLPILLGWAISAQMVRWSVLGGLVLISTALLVLIRTSWGHAQPLRKCIVLSTLVHTLAGAYLTTVNIVAASHKPPEQRPFQVSVIDGPVGEHVGDAHSPIDEEAGDAVAMPHHPWEQLAAAPPTPNDPWTSAPKRAADERIQPTRTLPSESAALSAPTISTPAIDPGSPPVAAQTSIVQRSAATAAALETPAAPSETSPPTPQAVATKDPPSNSSLPDVPAPAAELAASNNAERDPDLVAVTPNANDTQRPSNVSASSDQTAGRLVPVGENLLQPNVGKAGDTAGLAPVPSVYAERVDPNRARYVLGHGGTPQTEAAVALALKFLAAQQSADGRWDTRRLGGGREVIIDGQDRRGAGSQADTGITGLSLLSFLAAGQTHQRGEYQDTVRRGLQFLLSSQAVDGNLGGSATMYEKMYCHGMASFALSEAYAMSQDARLEKPVRRAIGYTLAAQSRSTGGWRYQPGDAGDTSQLGWQAMALKSAQLAGIETPSDSRDGMIRFLKSVSSGTQGGLASYKPGHRVSRTMTAEALVCRQFLGMSRDNPASGEAAAYVVQELPGAGRTNLYYWYYATLGLYQAQGEAWEKWNAAMQKSLLQTQRPDGSWDPDEVWGAYGGRAYSTALSALCLEVYYRFLPTYIEAAGRDRATR